MYTCNNYLATLQISMYIGNSYSYFTYTAALNKYTGKNDYISCYTADIIMYTCTLGGAPDSWTFCPPCFGSGFCYLGSGRLLHFWLTCHPLQVETLHVLIIGRCWAHLLNSTLEEVFVSYDLSAFQSDLRFTSFEEY